MKPCWARYPYNWGTRCILILITIYLKVALICQRFVTATGVLLRQKFTGFGGQGAKVVTGGYTGLDFVNSFYICSSSSYWHLAVMPFANVSNSKAKYRAKCQERVVFYIAYSITRKLKRTKNKHLCLTNSHKAEYEWCLLRLLKAFALEGFEEFSNSPPPFFQTPVLCLDCWRSPHGPQRSMAFIYFLVKKFFFG